jgi:hypothetical protein
MLSGKIKEAVCNALQIGTEQFIEYPSSHVDAEGGQFLLCRAAGLRKILALGGGSFFDSLEGDPISLSIKLCPLTHENRLILNRFLPYTLPSAFGRGTATFGLGDRLGLASPGHIRCFKDCRAKPILAQQSKRELDLTGRNYEQVMDDVCFAVFQEGYRGGFGADGDHLKNADDIQSALACGYTMITLDCSEKIGRGIESLSSRELSERYGALNLAYRERIEFSYLSKGFLIDDVTYSFKREDLMRCALIYRGVIDYSTEIWRSCITNADHQVDFELSIDETESVTTAQGHLFVAMELDYNKVEVTSLAPRFVGEFQKGIDYIGDPIEFEVQLAQHAAIARHFGYKLSIHSGSDKFSVFPRMGKHTKGLLHLKTSGTSWLEAVGTIAERDPLHYRRIHQMALMHFDEAKSFYHVSGDPSKIENPAFRTDETLIDYLKDDNSRQLLHITYGCILSDPLLRQELYRILEENEEHYYNRLVSHIGRHLKLLGLAE